MPTTPTTTKENDQMSISTDIYLIVCKDGVWVGNSDLQDMEDTKGRMVDCRHDHSIVRVTVPLGRMEGSGWFYLNRVRFEQYSFYTMFRGEGVSESSARITAALDSLILRGAVVATRVPA